jgi:hypothetical protein
MANLPLEPIVRLLRSDWFSRNGSAAKRYAAPRSVIYNLNDGG